MTTCEKIMYGAVGFVIVLGAVSIWRCRRKPRLELSFLFPNVKIKGDHMAVTLTTSQQVRGTVQPVDRHGKPASVEAGSVQYELSNPDVATVEEDPNDETKFTVRAKSPGVSELRVTADADLGQGITPIETFAAIEVIPEGAVGFGIQFGQAEDQQVAGDGGGGTV